MMSIYLGLFERLREDICSFPSFFITSLCQKMLENVCSKVATTMWIRWRNKTQTNQITDKRARTNYEIWHWTPRRRLVWVWIYYPLLTRGECDSEFFEVSNKTQTMPPSSDARCFIMHGVCKEECDHEGNPSEERQTRAPHRHHPHTSPPHQSMCFKCLTRLILPEEEH